MHFYLSMDTRWVAEASEEADQDRIVRLNGHQGYQRPTALERKQRRFLLWTKGINDETAEQ